MGAFDTLKGYVPEVQEDTEVEFKPFKGAYETRVVDISHKVGISERSGKEYDMYTLKLQVVRTVEGEKADNRFLDKIYTNDDTGLKHLVNDLFTAGIGVELTKTDIEFDNSLANAKDHTMNIRAWRAPRRVPDGAGQWVNVEPREDVQRFKVVASFKLSGDKKAVDSSSVPF